MPMLADFVVETANNPGTGTTVNLIGAATGPFTTFAARFTTGSQIFYTINDGGALAETGIGTFTAGSPNTLTRDTVLSNTLGTVSRVNFLGVVYVYSSIPAARAIYSDNTNTVALPGNVTAITGTFSSSVKAVSPGVGTVSLLPGTAVNPGFVGFFNALGTRVGFVGANAGSLTELALETENGFTGWRVTGNLIIGPGTNDTITMNASSGAAAILINSLQSPVSNFSSYASNLAATSSNHGLWQFGGNIVGSISPVSTTGVVYNTTSDATLKIDDGLIEGGEAIKILLALKPRWFRWKSAPDTASEPGFFAQQVHRIFPWAVTKGRGRGKKRIPWQMDNAKLLPLLVAALQGALARVDALEKGR